MAGKTLDLELLKQNHAAIVELDQQIASASGSETQVKKAIVEKLMADESNTAAADKLLSQLRTILDKQSGDVLAALVSRVGTFLADEYQPKVDEHIKGLVEAQQASSDVNPQALREQRKALVEQDGALRTILRSLGEDVDSVPSPKRGGGRPPGSGSGGGKSGKNREGYQFSIDGKERPPSQNSLSSVAFYATVGCPIASGKEGAKDKDKWSTQELKDFLAANGVTYGEQDTWEVSLPNGKKIGAVRVQDEPTTTEEAPAEVAPTA